MCVWTPVVYIPKWQEWTYIWFPVSSIHLLPQSSRLTLYFLEWWWLIMYPPHILSWPVVHKARQLPGVRVWSAGGSKNCSPYSLQWLRNQYKKVEYPGFPMATLTQDRAWKRLKNILGKTVSKISEASRLPRPPSYISQRTVFDIHWLI